MAETAEKQQSDSDMIFMQITHADFATLQEAESAIVVFYVPDMTISRAGISHAIGRLKRHFSGNKEPVSK
jgi:hypothetical protein